MLCITHSELYVILVDRHVTILYHQVFFLPCLSTEVTLREINILCCIVYCIVISHPICAISPLWEGFFPIL